MIQDLLRRIDDAGALHNRLVLVVGGTAAQRSALIRLAAKDRGFQVVALGADLARRLRAVPRRQRPLQAASSIRDAVESAATGEQPAVLDRIEILFDCSLQLDPLDTLKRLAHARTVIVNWPGELRQGRLTYAPANHPEHRSYPADGLVTFQPS